MHPAAAGAVQPASARNARRSAGVERAAPVRLRVSCRKVSFGRAARGTALPVAAAAAAAHWSVPAQVFLDMSQVQCGGAAGDADAALVVSGHEAAPASLPAERACDAAAARSHCRMAIGDVASTSGSDDCGTTDGASESDGTPGYDRHAGSPIDLAAVRFYRPSGPAGGTFEPSLSMPERARPVLCALTNSEGCAASSTLFHLHAGTQVAWRRAVAMRSPCSRSGLTEQ